MWRYFEVIKSWKAKVVWQPRNNVPAKFAPALRRASGWLAFLGEAGRFIAGLTIAF